MFKPFILMAALATAATLSHAETITIYAAEQGTAAPIKAPEKGQAAEQVRQTYGNPAESRSPVGEPPISVWRYDQFTVYFERDKVVHTVLHRKPAD